MPAGRDRVEGEEPKVMAKTAKTHWSFAEDRQVIQLAKSGKSIETIATMMERPIKAVRRAALRLGVSVKAKAR
jgi:hypothetical protein